MQEIEDLKLIFCVHILDAEFYWMVLIIGGDIKSVLLLDFR